MLKKSKINKHLTLGVSTFVVLITLVVIQVLFMIKASKIEAKNFNHRVVMALKESRNEIARAAKACNNMNNYVCGNKCSSEVKHVNFQKVDSIIQSNLAIYKISLNYTFELNNDSTPDKTINMSCYEQSLNGLLEKNGIKLSIQFPKSTKFVYAQMGTLFYISILSILFVMISFFIFYRMYNREKGMLENTTFFIDNMIHEFHTPIANIKFASNLIKKNTPKDENSKINKYLELIQNENNKLECHVKDIQGLSHIDSSDKAPLNLNSIIQECAQNFVIPIKSIQGDLFINLDNADCIISGDAHLIKLVISNLIDNAIKYSNSKPKIEISTHKYDNKVLFKIKDNGIGIPNCEIKSIFKKYYRIPTGNIHNAKGFGLGLAFVKEVVDKHNASINVNNNTEGGVSFSIIFKQA